MHFRSTELLASSATVRKDLLSRGSTIDQVAKSSGIALPIDVPYSTLNNANILSFPANPALPRGVVTLTGWKASTRETAPSFT